MKSERMRRLPASPALTCLTLVVLALATGCDDSKERAIARTGGDPDRGRALIEQYGCSSCHTIPGIRDADSLVGPPLTRMAARSYIGGVLTNTPDHMVQWVNNAPGVDPMTAMPNLGVTETDARDIAGYLYTLR